MSYDHNQWVQNDVIVPKYARYRKWITLGYVILLVGQLFAVSLGVLDYRTGMLLFMMTLPLPICLGPSALNPMSRDEYQKDITGRAHFTSYYILAGIFSGLWVWHSVAGELGWNSAISGLQWFNLGLLFFMLVVCLPTCVTEFLLPQTDRSDFDEDEDVEIGYE